jgi:pimeloyl-ACP methyl ester carboxylesterase
MNPFYFGTGDRRIFGVYEAARRGARKQAAVLCHPWGSEYLHAHRSIRQLSNMLADAGIHALRFDYFGTGDSAGDLVEADMRGWDTDIQSAIEELASIAGVTDIALIGLRLGATLAAHAAAKCPANVCSLVMWDPVVSGPEYIQELLSGRPAEISGCLQTSARAIASGGGYEIVGFPLTAAMVSEFHRIDLTALTSELPARTLVVASHRVASHQQLERAFARRSAGPLAVEYIAGVPAWIERPLGHPHAGMVPVKTLQRIVEWLA